MSAIRRVLLRFASFFRPGRAEEDLAREINAHLRLIEDSFVAQGMSAEEARYAAKRAFGGVEQTKEHHRAARSFGSIDTWWLDLKLGFRMLVKYPGLALVGSLGMAVAIAVGAVSFAVLYASIHPTLPLDEGDRIVGLENWDVQWNNQEHRVLHDFVTWRRELTSVEDLSAFAPFTRNLITSDGGAKPVIGADITASAFRVARVPPLLGRHIVDDDERPGAPAVIVIGYDVWRTRLASDPAVVGQTVRLGTAVHTIVGVMPEGFAFPVSQRVWIPLRVDPAAYNQRRGPALNVFGRLAPGVTMDRAQAELTAIGWRAAAAFPQTHERLRPRVVRYTELWFDDGPLVELQAVQLLVTMLLVVVAVNVSALVYARTATREREIAVRTALGASRRRIVGQLFVEALVLAAVAAAAGLALTRYVLEQGAGIAELIGLRAGGLPFWMSFDLSFGTVIYVLALTILAATIVGVVPAIKATGRRMQSSLRDLGGITRLQLGGTWTTLIVVQVGFAVALLPAALSMAAQSIGQTRSTPGFAADQYLVGVLKMDEETPSNDQARAYAREFQLRYRALSAELVRRVENEPAVSDVTVTMRAPGIENTHRIEVEGAAGATSFHNVRSVHVGADFFDAFEVPMLAGRRFQSGDLSNGSNPGTAVIVNQTFVEQVLGDSHAVGRRVRYANEGQRSAARPWFEIVGVVSDLPANPILPGETEARLYQPMIPGEDYWGSLVVRIRSGDPTVIAERLRKLAIELDPALRLDVRTLSDVYHQEQLGLHWGALGLAVVTCSVLFLSAAGIYALMSFTVTRRRREIGIRAALGGDRRRILASVLSRTLAQLAAGTAVGIGAAALLDFASDGALMGGQGVVILPAVSVCMLTVGLLAALGPARRGLRINPTEALREE